MLKLSFRNACPATLAAALLVGVGGFASGCLAGSDPTEAEDVDAQDDAFTGSSAVSRAEQWVAAKLQYCQAANHHRDYDDACSTYCERQDNPAWDPYRSDCSGLVSWAWGLPAPGRVTGQFAPFENDITHVIQASDLQPGDAVNNDHHIMLFKGWTSHDHEATFIEEPGCSTSITHAHEFTSSVSVSGTSIHVSYVGMTFTAIRYGGGGGGGGGGCVPGGLYCGGDKVHGDASTLYRCTSGTSGTVVEHCSAGCSVNSGRDDACNASGGGGGSHGSGGCVHGGLYCGGDKVTGDVNTLYRCTSGDGGTVVEHCAHGCEVNAGADDACRPVTGGDCVHGGFYCGGDKVNGDANTLYRCTSGHEGTVVEHCASGCAVRSGQDDACR
ncbi:MAG TPA: hypothetical protein VHB21_11745 [Minicystis sp.]|nr:hypothetical protein [Minicystis sp.]